MLATATSIAERISLAEDALAAASAELFELDVGRVIRQPAFPHVYDANLVRRARLRVETLDQSLRRLAAPLEQVGARHLQLSLDGADVPDAVGLLLRRRGFGRERLLAMTLPGAAHGAPDPEVCLLEVPSESAWERFVYAMDRMNREEAWYAPSVSLEIVGSMRAKHERGAIRIFIAVRDGRVVGAVGMGLFDRTASVLSVGTLPHARGQGVGRTLVLGVVERARALGADLIYLVARADDSPQQMYCKLGFEVCFGFDVWLRPPR